MYAILLPDGLPTELFTKMNVYGPPTYLLFRSAAGQVVHGGGNKKLSYKHIDLHVQLMFVLSDQIQNRINSTMGIKVRASVE